MCGTTDGGTSTGGPGGGRRGFEEHFSPTGGRGSWGGSSLFGEAGITTSMCVDLLLAFRGGRGGASWSLVGEGDGEEERAAGGGDVEEDVLSTAGKDCLGCLLVEMEAAMGTVSGRFSCGEELRGSSCGFTWERSLERRWGLGAGVGLTAPSGELTLLYTLGTTLPAGSLVFPELRTFPVLVLACMRLGFFGSTGGFAGSAGFFLDTGEGELEGDFGPLGGASEDEDDLDPVPSLELEVEAGVGSVPAPPPVWTGIGGVFGRRPIGFFSEICHRGLAVGVGLHGELARSAVIPAELLSSSSWSS